LDYKSGATVISAKEGNNSSSYTGLFAKKANQK
jgi:hypothetical protein